MIKMIVDAGHAQNCKVCLCGELAGGYQIDGDIFADGGRCIVCGTGMYITSAEGTEGGLHRRNVILAYPLRLY